MPVLLSEPVVPPPADTAKVVAFKVEDNVEAWIIIWVCQGSMDGEEFVPNPMLPVLEFKIEDGNHPLANGRALRRCPDCDKWHGLETECTECGAELLPYDGFTRIAGRPPPDVGTMYECIKSVLYEFLCTEAVPTINPDGTLGDEAVLLPAGA